MRQFSADEITSAIRRGPNCYAAKDFGGDWWFFAANDICFIKEKAGTIVPMRPLQESEIERIQTMLRYGLITCISISTPYGIYSITKRMVS